MNTARLSKLISLKLAQAFCIGLTLWYSLQIVDYWLVREAFPYQSLASFMLALWVFSPVLVGLFVLKFWTILSARPGNEIHQTTPFLLGFAASLVGFAILRLLASGGDSLITTAFYAPVLPLIFYFVYFLSRWRLSKRASL